MISINWKAVLRGSCEYILAFLLIAGCNSVYSVGRTRQLYMAILVFAGLDLFLWLPRLIGRMGRLFIVLGGYFGCLLLVFVLVENRASSFLARYGVLVPLLLVLFSAYDREQKDAFIRKIGGVTAVMAGTGLVIWLLGPVLGLLRPGATVVVNWGGLRYYKSYFGLLFTNRYHAKWIFGHLIYRNLGIYTEGPMASLVFTVGLAIELFYRQKCSGLRIMLLCAAVLTAFSTTGALLLPALFGVKLYLNTKKNSTPKGSSDVLIRIVTLTAAAAAVLLIGSVLLQNKQMTDSGNYYSHMNAFSNGFNLFRQNMLTGSGLTDSGDYGNSTSGIFKILSQGGLVFFFFYMLPYGIVLRKRGKGNGKLLILYSLFFVLFITVIWQYTFYYLAFMSFAYSYALERRETGGGQLGE